MGNVRGLRTRPCPKCEKTTPQRTLYARTSTGGKAKWYQLFWACAECGSLNHVLLPFYRLESASSQLPSALAVGVVNALVEGPLDFDELMTRMKQRPIPEVRHIFKSEVLLVLDYLKGRGAIDEETCDRTERTLDVLKASAGESRQLSRCPEEMKHHVVGRSLVTLYSQRRSSVGGDNRFTRVAVKCLHCPYYDLAPEALGG